MNNYILKSDSQLFIENNLNSNISKLILKGSPFPNITIQELANQIIAKKKSEKKLPTWHTTANVYYPPKLSIEQTSSELTAKYKSEIISGKTIIDITGGFGVDALYFSRNFESVFHCEINKELSKIVAYNYDLMKIKNINCFASNGIDYLKENNSFFDCIYIDPSRRNDLKRKVFLLEDCLPNVPNHLDFLFTKTNKILVKVSPVLDIKSTISELKNVKQVHIVAVDNEVKELLFLLEKNFAKEIQLITTNIKSKKRTNDIFSFFKTNKKHEVTYSLPMKYLYEPNAAIMKSGGFDEISIAYDLNKLHKHSHLYTSNKVVEFPGRIFEVEQIIPYNKKKITRIVPSKKANITVRNFPKTVAQIRKETKIAEGGDVYIFCTKLKDESKVLIINKKIN